MDLSATLVSLYSTAMFMPWDASFSTAASPNPLEPPKIIPHQSENCLFIHQDVKGKNSTRVQIAYKSTESIISIVQIFIILYICGIYPEGYEITSSFCLFHDDLRSGNARGKPVSGL